MEKARVAGRFLDRVAHRVAEVENASQPLLSLVLLDHARLDRDGALDERRDQLGLARHDSRGVALDQREQRLVEDHAVLDDFGEPGPVLALGQRSRASAVSATTKLG